MHKGEEGVLGRCIAKETFLAWKIREGCQGRGMQDRTKGVEEGLTTGLPPERYTAADFVITRTAWNAHAQT